MRKFLKPSNATTSKEPNKAAAVSSSAAAKITRTRVSQEDSDYLTEEGGTKRGTSTCSTTQEKDCDNTIHRTS
jgi:hypothetical protein